MASAIAGYVIGRTEYPCIAGECVEVATDTIVKFDTIVVNHPAFAEQRGRSHVTRQLPVADSAYAPCRQITDSIRVAVPIDTFVYRGESFRAIISGYEAKIDTMQVFRTSEIVTVSQKPRRWAVSCGAGISLTRSGVSPGLYIGIGYVLHTF